MLRIPLIFSFICTVLLPGYAGVNIPQTIILTSEQQKHVRLLIRQQADVQQYWKEIQQKARLLANDQPRPLRVIHYEGLLDTDSSRMATEQSLQDMEKVALLLYAYYGTPDKMYAEKAKSYIVAWINTYQATGNPINEYKFEPLIHAYQVLKAYFSPAEKTRVNQWLKLMAEAEMANHDIPENNWKTKHIKLVGTIGLVLNQPAYVQYAIESFKKYIANALYADGTSRDLHQRDALSYHVSGLKPLLTFAITLRQFAASQVPDLFRYENPEGGSIKKSVEYMVPFATGEKTHAEWVNSRVQLDKERAKAGIAHYQPGTLYEPKDSQELFELASYFDQRYREIARNLAGGQAQEYTSRLMVIMAATRKN